MTRLLSIAALAMGILGLGTMTLLAQEPRHKNAIVYQCSSGAHCSINCSTDGEKVVQTGSPKEVSVTMLAPNNYFVELVEQNEHIQSIYLTGTKIICNIDGLTAKGE